MNSKQKVQLIARTINFLNTTSGRDKTCRFVQYLPRIIKALIGVLNKHDPDKLKPHQELFDKLDIISSQCSMTRKILRFLRYISIIREMNRLVHKQLISEYDENDIETHKSYVVCKLLGDLSLALFFISDHFLWFTKTGLIKNQNINKQADFYSNLFWLFDCIFTILHRIISISQKNREIKQIIQEQKDLKTIAIKSQQIDQEIIDMTRCIIDIPVAIGFIRPGFISNGLIGILGTTTSLIGCYQNFK